MVEPQYGEVPFFASLPPGLESRLRAIFKTESHSAGSRIFQEGDSVDRVFFVTKGHVALEMQIPGHPNQRILSLGPGDLLGWSPMVGGATMVATAIAIDDCELAAASADELRRLCETDLEFGYYFMRQLAKALARRLLAARLQLLDLFRQETLASTSPEASL
jgi:CRP-like cAMP-binding protein